MSQKTVRRASTLAASNIATVVPSEAPAVLAANTARISDQGGGCPWISSVSYPPSACILEIFSPNSPLICATAWAGEIAPVVSSGPAKKIPSGEARMMPHRQMTTTTAITTPPPAVAAAARALAAAITARSARFAACAACLAVIRATFAAFWVRASLAPASAARRACRAGNALTGGFPPGFPIPAVLRMGWPADLTGTPRSFTAVFAVLPIACLEASA